ncbi:MAG: sigma-54 dependent transcriptional regulator [Bryobacteraceae bacterium]
MPETAARNYLGMPAIVASEPMRQLLLAAERVAMTTATVLITGESGSGKELVARAVHQHSMRASKAWVDVSCAALPEHLMESELFGFEKGAFSGADVAKPGLFELAHQGTLFLDEIGELEPRMQVKLLRVLDGTPYYRLGGTRKVTVDVRVVAATNQDLEKAVSEGRFRNDLFHRLSQIALKVPPLRQRLDDILPLANHFLAQQNPELHFANSALEAMSRYAWPGNIRELRNTVVRAAVMAREPEIRVSHLPETIRGMVSGTDFPPQAQGSGSGQVTLDAMERRMIFEALERTAGHQQRAAELLGISRRTLSRKLKIYGIEDAAGQPIASAHAAAKHASIEARARTA